MRGGGPRLRLRSSSSTLRPAELATAPLIVVDDDAAADQTRRRYSLLFDDGSTTSSANRTFLAAFFVPRGRRRRRRWSWSAPPASPRILTFMSATSRRWRW